MSHFWVSRYSVKMMTRSSIHRRSPVVRSAGRTSVEPGDQRVGLGVGPGLRRCCAQALQSGRGGGAPRSVSGRCERSPATASASSAAARRLVVIGSRPRSGPIAADRTPTVGRAGLALQRRSPSVSRWTSSVRANAAGEEKRRFLSSLSDELRRRTARRVASRRLAATVGVLRQAACARPARRRGRRPRSPRSRASGTAACRPSVGGSSRLEPAHHDRVELSRIGGRPRGRTAGRRAARAAP